MRANTDIRNAAKCSGVFLWQVADALGVQESSFSKRLRKELPAGEKEKILAIIDALAAEQREAG